MDKKKVYGVLSGFAWGFVAALIASNAPLGSLVAPGLLAIVGVRAGAMRLLTAAGGLFAGALLFLGLPGIAECVQCLLPALAMVLVYRRVTRFETLVLTTGASLFGSWASIGVLSLLTGEDQMAALYRVPVEAISQLKGFFAGQIAQAPAAGVTAAQLDGAFSQLTWFAQYATPMILVLIAMAVGLVTVILVSWSLRRARRTDFLLPPFSRWYLPRSFALGMTALLIFALVGDAQGWPNFTAVLLCAQAIFYVAYGLAGFAVIDAVLQMVRANKAVRILVPIGLLVFTAGYVALMVGVLDALFHFRRRMDRHIGPL